MAQWVTIAKGVRFSELEQVVEDMDLPKGTEIKVVMETPMPWLFDLPGAELAFKLFVPDGIDLLDVYGEGDYAYAKMEVDPPYHIWAILGAIAKWGAIALAVGIALALIVSFIYIMVKVPAGAAIPITLLVGAAIGIVAIIALSAYARKPKPVKGGKT